MSETNTRISAEAEQQKKRCLFQRMKEGLARSTRTISDGITGIFTKKKLDRATLDELEELLNSADLGVETAADLASLPGYAAIADRILFDARAPKDATRPGGLGMPFDWHLLENLDLEIPFMLSGGLTADNLAEALRVTRAGGVDVSSGVESAPGVKDADMIRDFIRAARAADSVSPA